MSKSVMYRLQDLDCLGSPLYLKSVEKDMIYCTGMPDLALVISDLLTATVFARYLKDDRGLSFTPSPVLDEKTEEFITALSAVEGETKALCLAVADHMRELALRGEKR